MNKIAMTDITSTEDIDDILSKQALDDLENDPEWLEVPGRVKELYVKYAAAAHELAKANPDAEYWELDTEECGPIMIKNSAGDPSFWSQLGTNVDKLGPALHSGVRGAQKFLGGPNPIAAMLLAGGLSAGVGYGAGSLLHKLLPQWFRSNAGAAYAALAGLGGAAVPGLVHAYPNVKELGWLKGLSYPTRFQGRTTDVKPDMSYGLRDDVQKPFFSHAFPTPAPKPVVKGASAEVPPRDLPSLLANYEEIFGTDTSDVSGGGYLRPIDTNEWGQAVGVDPFMTGTQKAIFAGVPAVASAARGSRWVTPMDVTRVAVNAGLGGMMGRGIAEVAGPFLALSPKAKEGVQNLGILAGALKALTGVGV